ncbi:MAG: hypothetical protein AAGJ37_01730 [Pseudomonadota bacterium]
MERLINKPFPIMLKQTRFLVGSHSSHIAGLRLLSSDAIGYSEAENNGHDPYEKTRKYIVACSHDWAESVSLETQCTSNRNLLHLAEAFG